MHALWKKNVFGQNGQFIQNTIKKTLSLWVKLHCACKRTQEDIFLACANIKQISYACRMSKMGCEALIKTHGHKSLLFLHTT